MKTLKRLSFLMVLSILLISCDKEEDEVIPPQIPVVAEWAGVYITETEYWGTYYSPLIITTEGKLLIAEHEIDFEFDEAENRLAGYKG